MSERVMAWCLIYTGGSDGNVCITCKNSKSLHSFLMHFYCTHVLMAKCSTLFCLGMTNNLGSNPQNSSVFLFFLS